MLTFIVNPNSGGESGFSAWKKIERYLKKNNIEFKVYITDCKGNAIQIARHISKKLSADANADDNVIVSVGGDGTFNEVLNGIEDLSKVTVGLIPVGTGNDLAKALGIPKDPIEAVNVVLKRNTLKNMDYGVATISQDGERINRRFAISCGIGYDAAVCVAIDNSQMRRKLAKFNKQKAVYTILGAREILVSDRSRGYAIADGEKKNFSSIVFISVQNQVTEGGGYRFTPQASNEDGKLSVCAVDTKGKLEFASTLIASMKAKHGDKKAVDLFDCEKIEIHTEKPLAFHTDGETFEGQTLVEVRCIKRGLRIII